ncbi:MAG TPA: multicopper oxidase domain-containing protein, partial [Steroidobacteraceae bacterium]|nr:multicopper oxidase domain-containing protein [Steroidobacteraceae bacterium]
QWQAPASSAQWNYTAFGQWADGNLPPDITHELSFSRIPGAPGLFDRWAINAGTKLAGEHIELRRGKRHRLFLRNQSGTVQSVHLHRPRFELIDVNGTATGGIFKDTVVVPPHAYVAIDLTPIDEGACLFQSQCQQHADLGLRAVFYCV